MYGRRTAVGEFAAMQKPQLDWVLFDRTGLRPGAHRDHRARPTGNVNRQLVASRVTRYA
jgi:hypothetical protein